MRLQICVCVGRIGGDGIEKQLMKHIHLNNQRDFKSRWSFQSRDSMVPNCNARSQAWEVKARKEEPVFWHFWIPSILFKVLIDMSSTLHCILKLWDVILMVVNLSSSKEFSIFTYDLWLMTTCFTTSVLEALNFEHSQFIISMLFRVVAVEFQRKQTSTHTAENGNGHKERANARP